MTSYSMAIITGAFDYVRTIINQEKKKAKILAMKALRLGENSEAAEGQKITEDHMKDRSHHHEREIRVWYFSIFPGG